jgi:hypothetical protein
VKDGIATPQPIVTGTALDRMWAVECGGRCHCGGGKRAPGHA